MGGIRGTPNWRLGANHSAEQWQNRMRHRGWTHEQIEEAIRSRQGFAVANHLNPANGATRSVHPTTGRSVVLDDTTGEVIPVGEDGFVS